MIGALVVVLMAQAVAQEASPPMTLQAALAQSGGVQTKAADVLRISYRSFRHLMKKYEL